MPTVEEITTFTLEDVSKHKTKESPYLIIHGKVYDVARFIEEHPGGEEVLLESAGQDATTVFEDIGHSDDARKILKKLYIGEIESNGKLLGKDIPPAKRFEPPQNTPTLTSGMGFIFRIFAPMLFLGAYALYKKYTEAV